MKTIQNQTNQVIAITEEECSSQSLTLKSLSNCVIEIHGVLGALYIYSCTNCVIQAIFVKSACNIYKCTDCTINIVSQQMRINESSHLVLTLLTKSGPALVESSECVFKRKSLSANHKRLMPEEIFHAFDASEAWRNVQDFNSLNGQVANYVIN